MKACQTFGGQNINLKLKGFKTKISIELPLKAN